MYCISNCIFINLKREGKLPLSFHANFKQGNTTKQVNHYNINYKNIIKFEMINMKIKQSYHLLNFSGHIQQFFINNLNNFKWFWRSYRVYQDISMDIHRILCRENGIFILTRSIHQFQIIFLTTYSSCFCKCCTKNKIKLTKLLCCYKMINLM